MTKKGTFGHVDLARKLASQFGMTQEAVKVEMRYTKVVLRFIRKIEEAHEKAANSTLKFS